MEVDGADAKPAPQNPCGPNAIARHGLDDPRGLLPIERQARAAAAREEVGVAAAEKIVPQVEFRMAQPLERLAADEEIARAIDHRHEAAPAIGRPVDGMTSERAGSAVRKMRHDRTADNVDLSLATGGDHARDPFAVGDFIVVDHQNVRGRGETAARLLERAIAGAAIAGLRLDHAEAFQQAGVEEGVRDRNARHADRVVVDDDHGEPGRAGLVDQRLQRQAEHIGASTGRHANDGFRRRSRRAARRARSGTRDGRCVFDWSRILMHGCDHELRFPADNASNRVRDGSLRSRTRAVPAPPTASGRLRYESFFPVASLAASAPLPTARLRSSPAAMVTISTPRDAAPSSAR